MRGDWSNRSISSLSCFGIMFSLLYLSSFHIALILLSSSITIVALPLLTLFFFLFVLVDVHVLLKAMDRPLQHIKKKNIYNWIMFSFMGYGIMFPFIIFIIHMIFLLSYFGSLSGSYFVWKSTFIFLFF